MVFLVEFHGFFIMCSLSGIAVTTVYMPENVCIEMWTNEVSLFCQ